MDYNISVQRHHVRARPAGLPGAVRLRRDPGRGGRRLGPVPAQLFHPLGGLRHYLRPHVPPEPDQRSHRRDRTALTSRTSPPTPTLYNDSLLPLKVERTTSRCRPFSLPRRTTLNLLPNVNFGLPSGFTARRLPPAFPNLPCFGFDSRWPFDGTDNLATFTDNITWIKGSHSIKAGFYFEHEARNVSVYSVYNTAGTYYFGSDLGNPVDTGDPFSNALTGNLYGYGQDNLKPIHRTRYKQTEWFVQDSWKVSRRLTADFGMRFQRLGLSL